MRKQQGFTLVEVTIILLVLTILSTIMLPQLGNYNRLARYVKAREDVGAICASLKKMLDEVHQGALFTNNQSITGPVGLIVGPGRIPSNGIVSNGGAGNGAGGAGDSTCAWTLTAPAAAADTCEEDTDDGQENVDFATALLEEHLIENDPDSDNVHGDATEDYPNPADDPDAGVHGAFGAGAYFGWRGPYLDSLTTDPWGNRYGVNSFALYAPSGQSNATIYSSAVVCYSAGADSRVDTYFNQPASDDSATNTDGAGWSFGRDDIGAVLSAGGPF